MDPIEELKKVERIADAIGTEFPEDNVPLDKLAQIVIRAAVMAGVPEDELVAACSYLYGAD